MSGSKTTQTNKALPQYGNAYSQLLTQAQQTGSQPFTPYTGNLVAGFNPTQTGVFGRVANTVGATGSATADPYLAAAQGYFDNATTPLWEGVQHFSPSAVGQYESPYTTDVVNATQNQFNLQNAQEEAKLKGNVAAAGAFGGDRQAVLESELAGQQQAAQAPVIANLENQGFQTALGEFNTQQQNQLGADEANAWLNSQAAFGEASLGSEAQNLALTGESALGNVGQEQQALAQQQLNVPYEQWQQQQAFPYQQESWLSGIETGLGGAAGSTSTAKNSQSLGASILGGLESLTGLAGITGAFPSTSGTGAAATTNPGWLFHRGGAVARRAPGGGIANVILFRGRGLPFRADGGDLGAPANDDVNPPTAQASTGTDGTPFPNVDYQPQPIANTWTQDARMAPWEALLEAGGETLASGNVGRGITAGVQSYAQARKAAQEAEAKGTQAQNEGLYRQADVREAADKLWQEAQDAKARIKHEDAQLTQTQAFQNAEIQNMEKSRELESQRIGVEGQGSWQFVGTDPTSNLPIMLNSKSGQTVLGKSPIGAKPSANDPNFGGSAMPWQRYKPSATAPTGGKKPWQIYGGQ